MCTCTCTWMNIHAYTCTQSKYIFVHTCIQNYCTCTCIYTIWIHMCTYMHMYRYRYTCANLLKMPPKTDALRHSGWESRLLTSSTVTLYFCVDERRERRPGTRQNMSEPRGVWWCPLAPPIPPTLLLIMCGSCDMDSASSGSGVESVQIGEELNNWL